MKKLLFISNGHGEDSIAKTIIKQVKEINSFAEISVLPLVGPGKSFDGMNLKVIGPRKQMPSGGFEFLNFLSFLNDLRAGLILNVFKQIGSLKNEKVDVCISVGDIYPLLLMMLFGKGKKVHIGTAISSYMRKHYKFEEWLMKKCDLVFPRDAYTADELKKANIKASFVGNVMMDNINNTHLDLGIPQDKNVIGILPSSRSDAYDNIAFLADIANEIALLNNNIVFLISLAPNLSEQKAKQILERPGHAAVIKVISGHFSETINRSKIILGMTGTGCEQAAGLGKPVIIPEEKGLSTSRIRIEQYKRLLGEAILTVKGPAKDVAKEALALFQDEDRILKMGAIGKERMGGPGGAEKIAKAILEIQHATA